MGEEAPPLIFGASRKGFHINRGGFGKYPIKGGFGKDFWGRPYVDKYFTPNISRPSNADTSRPATSLNTENAENKNDINPTQEDAQPV